MKKLYLTILYTIALIALTSYSLFATNWYVRPITGEYGSENGTSWDNAFDGFADIAWGSIAAGDYLYVSGGADSAIYYEQLSVSDKSGTQNNRIYIMAGKYSPSPSGHSGRVIIDGGYAVSYGNGLRESSIEAEDGANYITFKGFELRHGTMGVNQNCDYGGKGLIYDSLNIYDYYDQAGITVKGGDSTIIRYCRIVSFEVNDTSDETDGIYADESSRICVHNCYIRNRNQGPTAHNDAIQGQNADGWVIYNNIIITDSVNSTQGGGVPWMLGSTNSGDDNPYILYNNFCYMGGAWYCTASPGWAAWLRFYGGIGQQNPAYVLHNTVVVNGPGIGCIVHEFPTVVELNNLYARWCPSAYRGSSYPGGGSGCRGWYSYGTYDVAYILNNNWGIYPKVDSIRNCLYWQEDSVQTSLFVGEFTYSGGVAGAANFSAWVALGGTGLNRNPKLVYNIGREPDQGVITGEIQSSSPAINAGEDAEWYIDWLNDTYNLQGDFHLEWADINGLARDDTPDIGAYEYTAEGSDTVVTVAFTPITNAELGSYHIGKARISGDADDTFHTWAKTSTDTFKVNYNGTKTVGMVTTVIGDTIYSYNVASAINSTKTTNSVMIAGVQRNFDVTTKSEPPPSNETKLGRFSNGNLIKASDGKLIRLRQ